MKKLSGAIIAAALAVSLLAAPSASAATEVGDNCAATGTLGSNFTAFQFAKGAGNPLPIVVPSGGIITGWKVNSKIMAEFPQQLKVLRPTGNPKVFSTVAESNVSTVLPGQNTFETRIPVQGGDRIGVAAGSTSLIYYCPSSDPLDEMAYNASNVAVGSTNEYTQAAGFRVAVAAVVEPDADNDGFGDETQDKCPRSAALQAVECPLITLGSFGLAKKGSALILATASSAAQVSVAGKVKLPKAGKKGKARTATMPAGTKSVSPGQVVAFTIGFSQALRKALAALPPKKSLTMTVTTATTDLAGQLSSTQLKLKLKGQLKKAKG